MSRSVFVLFFIICCIIITFKTLAASKIPYSLYNAQGNKLTFHHHHHPVAKRQATSIISTTTTSDDFNDRLRYNEVSDNYDYRYPDGSYEFRYELADATTRYEKGYFIYLNGCKILVVLGYYSYRMPNGQYVTVFYNADHNGFRQTQAITQHADPSLPRSMEVPTATTTIYNNSPN